jgi:hypothetical protein
MPRFRVPVTRDCTFTQTSLVEIEADTAEQAMNKALELTQDEILELGGWMTDDDDSFHYGEETGTYCPDPDAIEEIEV